MNGQAAESGGRELEGAEVQINVESSCPGGRALGCPCWGRAPSTPSLGGRTGLAMRREGARGSTWQPPRWHRGREEGVWVGGQEEGAGQGAGRCLALERLPGYPRDAEFLTVGPHCWWLLEG